MNNSNKFKEMFGIYATELWSMGEDEILTWLNTKYIENNQTINISSLVSIVNDYVSDINLAEIAEHIKQNNLSEWISRWKFAFERDVLDLLQEYIV